MPDDVYTHGHHEAVLRSHTWRTVDNSARYLSEELRPGRSVLDVGCGPGTITVDIARHVAPGRVVGLDRAADVVARAEADAPADDLHASGADLSFRTGDVYTLPFDDGEFDVVHAHQVLQHLSDPVAALREMRRVRRPGGVVAARDSDYGGFCWAPVDERLDAWLAAYRAVARANGAEPDAGRHLLGWAQQAGFAEVRPSASVWCFATPAERAWWGGLWAERVTSSALAEQAVAGGVVTAAELAAMAQGFRDWAARPDGWFVVLHGEVVATG